MDCTQQRLLSETPGSKNDKLECTDKTHLLTHCIWFQTSELKLARHRTSPHETFLGTKMIWRLKDAVRIFVTSPSRPWGCSLDLGLDGEISEIAPRLCNQHTSRLLCAVPPRTERKHRDVSLWSHCSFLRDTVAATVQLSWPGAWLAAGSFSHMPAAFQLGTKRDSFAKHTMASV